MKFIKNYLAVTAMALVGLISSPSYAHLLPDQHGTINVVNDGAYMVLSIPISAFKEIDDNNDGGVSMIEFNNHRSDIVDQIRRNTTLSENGGIRELQGILLSPLMSHTKKQQLNQITVLGKFLLYTPNETLNFKMGLYGEKTSEREFEISATRKSDGQKHVFKLVPMSPEVTLFFSR